MKPDLRELTKSVRGRALGRGIGVNSAIYEVLDDRAEKLDHDDLDEERLKLELQQSVTGFSFLQPFLDDEQIEEVWINRPGEIWFAKNGRHDSVASNFTEDDLKTQVERMIRISGRRLDRSSPFIDSQLGNGFRLHAVIPDITREHLSLNIRKFSNKVLTVQRLVESGVLSKRQSEFLLEQLAFGANLLISGATQAGKTTLLSALISALDPMERIVSVEDTFELRCLLPDWVALQTRPSNSEGRSEIDLRRLVRESLRMRPNRLVVGEVRGAEALDMLIAMNSGIPSLCTIHANSAEDALKKMRTLPLLAGGNISSVFLDSIIQGSLNLFVHLVRLTDGNRRVDSIQKLSDSEQLSLVPVTL